MRSVGDGLYSRKPLLLNSMESLIAGDRIFVGNQPDDFALAGTLAPGQRILLLGLGYGGALRPLLSGSDDIEVVALDLNQNLLTACSALMDDFFPSLKGKIRYVLGDAVRFPAHVPLPFDAICVDLYTEFGYPSFILEADFWCTVREALTPQGVVIVNTWGLPEHLRPLEGETAQCHVAQVVRRQFEHVYALPYRRNMTLVGSRQSKPPVRKRTSGYQLQAVDRIVADLLPRRWGLAEEIKIVEAAGGDQPGSRTAIDQEMERRWPRLVSTLNDALKDCGHAEVGRHELKQLIYDPVRARAVTERLLDQRAPERCFVPVAVAACAFTESSGLDWYPSWLLEQGEELMRRDEVWFVNTALWQLLALVANPFAHFDRWAGDIDQLVSRLRLYE